MGDPFYENMSCLSCHHCCAFITEQKPNPIGCALNLIEHNQFRLADDCPEYIDSDWVEELRELHKLDTQVVSLRRIPGTERVTCQFKVPMPLDEIRLEQDDT